MGHGDQLSEFEKGQIVVWKNLKIPVAEMARQLGRSRDVISKYIKSPETYGKNYKGRKATKLTEYDLRRLSREVTKTGASSTTLVSELQRQVTPRWIRKKLNSMNIFKYVRRNVTPMLTFDHKMARLDYAMENLQNPPDWERIIWSDEKKFNLDGPDGLQSYWRDLRHVPQTRFSRSFGGKSVMVWAAFSADGASEVAFLHGNQTSCRYIWTLEEYLFPFAHELFSSIQPCPPT